MGVLSFRAAISWHLSPAGGGGGVGSLPCLCRADVYGFAMLIARAATSQTNITATIAFRSVLQEWPVDVGVRLVPSPATPSHR